MACDSSRCVLLCSALPPGHVSAVQARTAGELNIVLGLPTDTEDSTQEVNISLYRCRRQAPEEHRRSPAGLPPSSRHSR